MFSMRPRHAVSTKVLLYSFDHKKVLIMQYPMLHGLPGGHLEYGETPEEAIVREAREELGIELGTLQRVDFFLRTSQFSLKSSKHGSVILLFKGIAPKGLVLRPPRPIQEKGLWMTRDQVSDLKDFSTAYKQAAMHNWPDTK